MVGNSLGFQARGRAAIHRVKHVWYRYTLDSNILTPELKPVQDGVVKLVSASKNSDQYADQV